MTFLKWDFCSVIGSSQVRSRDEVPRKSISTPHFHSPLPSPILTLTLTFTFTSLVTSHLSLLSSHLSRLTSHFSRPTSHFSRLTSHDSHYIFSLLTSDLTQCLEHSIPWCLEHSIPQTKSLLTFDIYTIRQSSL